VSTPKKVRLNIRLDSELVEWARGQAEETGTSVTDLIDRGLRKIRDEERETVSLEVPQF
jgi:hypothetical protein